MVLLEEDEYQRLLQRADLWEPEMPLPDDDGNYPALETMAITQALDILRTRRRLGLSQAELARRAGIRVETLNRIEHGTNKPNVRAIDKIDRALQQAERKQTGKPKRTFD